MAGIKIVDLPAVGRDLAATDLFEMSLVGGTGSRKITGQEIMNASKLSVGSTPVINGTIGRILFEGAGNVLQESSSLFWDNTNSILQLNGSIRTGVSGSLTLNQFISSNIAWVQSFNNTTGSFGQLILQGSAISLRYGANTALQIATTGNVLINTTTDAGFRLDVNGTARVSGAAEIITGTSFTNIRRTSTGGLGIGIAIDGAAEFRINNVTKFYIGATAANSLEIPHTLRLAFVDPGQSTFSNILWSNANTQFNFVNGGNTDTVSVRFGRAISSSLGSTFESSAQLQADSTTRGFLPPRMTTTQKNAIASPAAGLQVYDTTLNSISEYNGSAWVSKQNQVTLTTTGTSGPATLVGDTLNVPQYQSVNADTLFQFYTRDGICIFDDMWYGQLPSVVSPQLSIFSSGSGAQITQSNAFFGLVPVTNQRGVVLFRTGTTATGSVTSLIGNSSSVTANTIFYIGNGVVNYETYVLFPILSDSTERFWFDFGITVSTSVLNPSEYIGIVYNEGTNFGLDNFTGGNPNFTFNTAANPNRTRTIGTSPVATNTWYRLRIEVNVLTPIVNFYVNDVLVATHTTNITNGSQRLQPVMRMVKTIGTTNREVAVDYIALKQTFITPR